MAECPECGAEIPDGHVNACAACERLLLHNWEQGPWDGPTATERCSRCGVTKPVGTIDFSPCGYGPVTMPIMKVYP